MAKGDDTCTSYVFTTALVSSIVSISIFVIIVCVLCSLYIYRSVAANGQGVAIRGSINANETTVDDTGKHGGNEDDPLIPV